MEQTPDKFTLSEKIVQGITVAAAVGAVAFAILHFTKKIPSYAFLPCLALISWGQAYLFRKRNRSTAVINLIAAVFITLCTVIIFIMGRR